MAPRRTQARSSLNLIRHGLTILHPSHYRVLSYGDRPTPSGRTVLARMAGKRRSWWPSSPNRYHFHLLVPVQAKQSCLSRVDSLGLANTVHWEPDGDFLDWTGKMAVWQA
jgi:hypothetical protein